MKSIPVKLEPKSMMLGLIGAIHFGLQTALCVFGYEHTLYKKSHTLELG